MSTAAVIVGCVLAALSFMLTVAVTLVFSKIVLRTLDHTDSVHSNDQKLLRDLLDRLMAQDFDTYKGWSTAEAASLQQFGGFEAPEDQRTEVIAP